MDTTVVIAIVAVVLIAAAAGAYVLMRRRGAKPATPVLSQTSEDRTFVGIAAAPRVSDATMVGPAVAPAPPRSDATVAMSAPAPARAEAATMPTVRIPKLHARVTVTKGGSGTHELEAREYTVGRSASCDIVLADPSVSGHHAKLLPHGDAFAVVDLGSTNGTSVDGRAVPGEYVLRTGETIGVGDARLRYERIG